MRVIRPLLGPSIVASVLFAGPMTAHAQASAAEALFDQGRQALTAGDLETACARFRASDQVEPAAGTRANLGDCEERRGKIATAWEVYRSALAKLPPGDSRVSVIHERIAKLEARLPKLVLTLAPGAPKETLVREGEATLGAATTYGVPLPLDPGVHRLVVTAPDRPTRNVEVTLAEGKTTMLAVEPGSPEGALASPSPAGPVTPPPPAESGSPGPWIVGGIGLAALVAGGVTGGIVIQDKGVANTHCTDGPPPTCRDQTGMDAASAVRTLGPVSTVSLVVGAAGVAAGAVWLGVRGPGKSSARVGIGPTVGGAAWSLEGSW